MKELTILIPTYNRPNYLKRILGYYDKDKNDFRIIIADSSSDENKELNKKNILSFSNLNILYLNHYNDKFNPANKLVNALNHVESEYCLFCADDDFIIPRGIEKSAEFLERNPGFTVVHGKYISFYIKDRKKSFYWKLRYPSAQSNSFSTAEARFIEHLSNYPVPTFYGVHRTNFLRMILAENLKFTDDPQFSELLSSMLTLIYGKMKYLNILYSAREIPVDYFKVTRKNIKDFIEDGSYNKKYIKFRECLTLHLSKNSALSVEKSKKIIDKAMNVYLIKNYPDNLKNKIRTTLKHLSRGVIYNKIMSAYVRIKLSQLLLKNNFPAFLNILSPKDYEEFNKIRNHIISYVGNEE